MTQAATPTEVLLTAILTELRRGPALGFGHPPSGRYIYANRQYSDCLWYFYNGEKKEHDPIAHHALTGLVEKLEIETKEYKNKPEVKLNLHLRADRRYVIQSGFNTEFAKGLLARLNQVSASALRSPLTIGVQAGETDQVLFCRLWDSQGEGIKVETMEGLDYVAIAADIAARIAGDGDRPAPPPKAQPKPVVSQPKVKLADRSIPSDAISMEKRRELFSFADSKGLTEEGLKYGLRCNGFASTAQLTELKCAELMVAISDGAIVTHWNSEAIQESKQEAARLGAW
jgi:hypothetical protein